MLETMRCCQLSVVVIAALVAVAGCDKGEPKPPAPAVVRQPPAVRLDASQSAAVVAAAHDAAGSPASGGGSAGASNGATAQVAEMLSTAESNQSMIEVGGLEFPKPPTWTWQQPSMAFRTLQYAVPAMAGSSSGAAELIISLFKAGDGGPIQANIDRWAGQFTDSEGKPLKAVVESSESNGLRLHQVELAGAYRGVGAAASRNSTRQLGLIVETPSHRVFVRMLGPDETVSAHRGEFAALVAGTRIRSQR